MSATILSLDVGLMNTQLFTYELLLEQEIRMFETKPL